MNLVGVGPLLLEAWWDKGPPHLCYFYFCHLIIVSQWATLYWQLSDISFDIHVLYFIVFFLMSMFVLAAKLLFIDSYYFLLVQLLNDLYQQSLFVCSCSKRPQGSAIKHQQGINEFNNLCLKRKFTIWFLINLSNNLQTTNVKLTHL